MYYKHNNDYGYFEYRKDEEVTWGDIPKVIVSFFKLFFWIMFLYYVGIFHLLASCLRTDKEIQSDQQAQMKVNNFLQQKLKEADSVIKCSKGYYSPREYFAVLRGLDEIKSSVGPDVRSFQFEFEQIHHYLDESLRNGKCTDNELDEARNWYKSLPALKKKPKEPSPPHVCGKYIHHISWSNLPQWFWHIYKHMFLYVIFLLLIWVYQKKDQRTLSLRSPLSFVFFILIHPVYMAFVIVRSWRETWKEWNRGFHASVELRRRKKNIFEKFSEEERSAIRAFAKSAQTFKEFITWAEKFGSRKHLALIAVIISGASSCTGVQTSAPALSTYNTVGTSPNHVEAVSVDHDVGAVSSTEVFFYDMYDWIRKPIMQVSVRNGKVFHFLLSSGYSQTREPVPIEY